MQKFKRKDLQVEAVQWFPLVVVNGVNYRPAEIIRSHDLGLYYIWNGDYRPDVWLSVRKGTGNPPDSGAAVYTASDGSKYWRRVFPFAFYDIKSHKTIEPANLKDELFKDYGGYMKWPADAAKPVQTGWVKINGKNETIRAGDWLVQENGQVVEICSDEDFRKKYQAI